MWDADDILRIEQHKCGDPPHTHVHQQPCDQDPVEIGIGPLVDDERTQKRPQRERITCACSGRLLHAHQRQHEADQRQRNKARENGRRVVRRVKCRDQDIADAGADRGHDVDPGTRHALVLLRHDIGDQARISARQPVPPERQVQEGDRVNEQTAARTKRRHQHQADAAAEHANDQRGPAPPARIAGAVGECAGQRSNHQGDDGAGRKHRPAQTFLVG